MGGHACHRVPDLVGSAPRTALPAPNLRTAPPQPASITPPFGKGEIRVTGRFRVAAIRGHGKKGGQAPGVGPVPFFAEPCLRGLAADIRDDGRLESRPYGSRQRAWNSARWKGC